MVLLGSEIICSASGSVHCVTKLTIAGHLRRPVIKLHRRTLAQSIADISVGVATFFSRSSRRCPDQREPRWRFARRRDYRFGYEVVRGSSSRRRERDSSTYGGACIKTRCGHNAGWSAWPGLRTWARHRFSRAKIRCVGVADESGIFALLATGKLGPFHYPATIC